MTSANSMFKAEHPTLVLWDYPEGWGGEGGGWGVQDGGIHVYPWLIQVNVWQKPPQCCKIIRHQLKLIKKRKVGILEVLNLVMESLT